MKLIVFDYVLLGIAAVIIGNHVVFMIYDKLRNREKMKIDEYPKSRGKRR